MLHEDAPWAVDGDVLRRWEPTGHAADLARPGGTATVITPRTAVAVLAAGWRPQAVPLLHP